MRRWLTAGALALAACGSDNERTGISAVLDVLPRGEEETAVPDPARLAQVAMARLREPVMLTVLEDRSAVAITVPLGQGAGVRTWTTQDRQTIALRDGLVVATRGLGTDVMRADTGGVRAAWGSGARYERSLYTLNGANEEIEIRLACAASVGGAEPLTLASGERIAARRIAEKCTGPEGPVQNLYWIDASGEVRQSRQWLGGPTGYLTMQVLRTP